MRKLRHTFAIRKSLLLSIAALAILAIPLGFSAARAKPIQTQSQSRAANPSDFDFDIVSIKSNKSDGEALGRHEDVPDGISLKNYPLQMLIKDAYRIYENYRYFGGPNWINSGRYDIEVKVNSSTADRLQKLNGADRHLADQHMLQVLLAERFKLKIHRDTKEFPVYFLAAAKGGSKLQESKANPDDLNAPKNAVWGGGRTVAGVQTITAKLMPVEQLASRLTDILGRKVLDKTGITGAYDFSLQFALEQNVMTPLESRPAPSAQDPNGVSIFTALQNPLGLKLESGKAPIEIIVIDHIERASGN